MKPARTLVSSQLFDRLVKRVVKDTDTDRELAEQIVDQTLAFLGACAVNSGKSLVPSPMVDIGWHAFILHTEEYAKFCHDIAGHFIHHMPNDKPAAPRPSVDSSSVRTRTLTAIECAGYAVDPDLWRLTTESCGSYHEDGNCSASGMDGNENTDTRTT